VGSRTTCATPGVAIRVAPAIRPVPATAQSTQQFSVLAITVDSHRSGNLFIFHDKLVEPGERSEILGTDKGRCAQIDNQAAAHCRVVFFLPAGKVKINGNIDFRRHLNKVPVVGGTRAYNGVGGKAILHNVSGRDTLIDFTLVK